jgi:XTP/dITP diphosphohydrolase
MKELVFATHNRHKAEEIRNILKGTYRIMTLEELNYHDHVPEDRDTLEGNASRKAWYVYDLFKKDCFADDTGLEVGCLDGAPGVFSARYAELSGDKLSNETASEANIRKLLKQMEGKSDRRARFRTLVCLILNRKEYFFEGIVKGTITKGKRGGEGFGYDPVFIPAGYKATFAEMSIDEKNLISHRAMAVRNLAEFLRSNSIQ